MMKDLVLKALASGALKRIAVLVVGVALVPLNKKLGLDISPTEVATTLLLIATYIAQSAWKEAATAKAVAAGQAAPVPSPGGVAAVVDTKPAEFK